MSLVNIKELICIGLEGKQEQLWSSSMTAINSNSQGCSVWLTTAWKDKLLIQYIPNIIHTTRAVLLCSGKGWFHQYLLVWFRILGQTYDSHNLEQYGYAHHGNPRRNTIWFHKKEQSNTICISNTLRPSDAYKRQKCIGSGNGVSHQAIFSTNADILLIWPLGMTSC